MRNKHLTYKLWTRIDLYKMAKLAVFTFSLCLLLSAVSTLPVAHDSVLVTSSSDKQTTLKLDAEALSPKIDSVRDKVEMDTDSVVVPSLIPDEDLKRNKREAIVGFGCAGEMIRFRGRCIPYEQYEKILKEDEYDEYDNLVE